MKIIVDNQIVKILSQERLEAINIPLLFESDNQIYFKWPALLEYLGLGSILSSHDQTEPLFVASVSALCASSEKEVVYYVYDRLFAEILSQIKGVRQINAQFLLQAIKEKKEKISNKEFQKILFSPLEAIKERLRNNPIETIHDLILYLAWDRVCMLSSVIFNYQSTDSHFIEGIALLKECLIESYQHISRDGRTSPSIYRMMESLFFYQMREERLDLHTADEWMLLSQSFSVLKDPEALADVYYIDDAFEKEGGDKESSDCYLTLDSQDVVKGRFFLINCILNKIQKETREWTLVLRPKKIVSLETLKS